MSAHFIALYRGQPLKFTFVVGHPAAIICARPEASPFISEADAWYAAAHHGLNWDFVSIEPAQIGHARALATPEKIP